MDYRTRKCERFGRRSPGLRGDVSVRGLSRGHLPVPVITRGLAAYSMVEAMLRLPRSATLERGTAAALPKKEMIRAIVDGGAS